MFVLKDYYSTGRTKSRLKQALTLISMCRYATLDQLQSVKKPYRQHIFTKKAVKMLLDKGFKRDMLYDPNRLETDYCILTASTFDVLNFINMGFFFTVGLMAKSATDQQLELLKKFKRILIIHPEPEAITLRLSPYCFCKAVRRNSAKELAVETVRSYF